MTWKCRPHKPTFLSCFWPKCLSLQQRGNQSRVLCEETQCVINFPFGYLDRDRPSTPGWPLPWESSFLSLQCAGIAGMSQYTCLLCKLLTRALIYREHSSGVSVGDIAIVFISTVSSVCQDMFPSCSLQLKAPLNPWLSVNTDRVVKQ